MISLKIGEGDLTENWKNSQLWKIVVLYQTENWLKYLSETSP